MRRTWRDSSFSPCGTWAWSSGTACAPSPAAWSWPRPIPRCWASFLDLRFLAGDEDVARGLAARLESDVFVPGAAGFAAWLAANNEARRRSHGDAGGMLEPNLKNGLGGLRDWHQVRWLARLARSRGKDIAGLAPDLERLVADARFVLDARDHLHRLSGRKNDKLYFEFQERLAEALGFRPENGRKGVECFLSCLLRRMADIVALRQSVWPVLAGACGAQELDRPAQILGDGVELAPEGVRFAPGLADAAAMDRIWRLLGHCAALAQPPSHQTMIRPARPGRAPGRPGPGVAAHGPHHLRRLGCADAGRCRGRGPGRPDDLGHYGRGLAGVGPGGPIW